MPSVEVSPSRHLHDGQQVRVTFKGVTGQSTVNDTVAQCLADDAAGFQNDPSQDCHNVTYVPVGVAPGVGDGTATITVRARDLRGHECNDTTNVCTINVRPDFENYTGSVATPISFGASESSSGGLPIVPIALGTGVVVLAALAVVVRRRRAAAGSP